MKIKMRQCVAFLQCSSLAVVTASLSLITLTGCNGGKVLRENVLATTQSTIGISLAQNPQTQVHELKAGFVRNEFFLVPTSKRVVYNENNKDAAGTGTVTEETDAAGNKIRRGSNYSSSIEENDPSSTPEVLAEIQVGGKGKQAIGTSPEQGANVEIYQRLAVGKIAVQSSAAVALMSQDAKTAEAVAGLKRSELTPNARSSDFAAISSFIRLMKGSDDPAAAQRVAGLDAVAKSIRPPAKRFNQFSFGKTSDVPTVTKNPYPRTTDPDQTSFSDANDALEYISRLNDSIRALSLAQKAADEGAALELSASEYKAIQTSQEAILDEVSIKLLGSKEFRNLGQFLFESSSIK